MSTPLATEEILNFLISELRSIRPTAPDQLPLHSLYKKDLDFDSLDLVELVARIEQRYGFLVPDADLPGFTCLGSTLEYIVGHLEP